MAYKFQAQAWAVDQNGRHPDDGSDDLGTATYETEEELRAAEQAFITGLFGLNAMEKPDAADLVQTTTLHTVQSGPDINASQQFTFQTSKDRWPWVSAQFDRIAKEVGLREIG